MRKKEILRELDVYLSREDSHLFRVVSNSKFVSVGVGSLTNVFIIKHYITEVKKLNKFCPKSYRTFLHCTDNVFLAYNGKEK